MVHTALDRRRPSIRYAQQAVADHYGYTVNHLTAHDRRPDLAAVRQIAYYVCVDVALSKRASIAQVARAFGRDHTTILFGLHRVRERMENDPILKIEVETICDQLRAVQP
jgi:chromosomal replication initiator protein